MAVLYVVRTWHMFTVRAGKCLTNVAIEWVLRIISSKALYWQRSSRKVFDKAGRWWSSSNMFAHCTRRRIGCALHTAVT